MIVKLDFLIKFLPLKHVEVKSSKIHKVVVCSWFNDFSLLQNNDLIGILDGAEVVSNDQGDDVLFIFKNSFLNESFIDGV